MGNEKILDTQNFILRILWMKAFIQRILIINFFVSKIFYLKKKYFEKCINVWTHTSFNESLKIKLRCIIMCTWALS